METNRVFVFISICLLFSISYGGCSGKEGGGSGSSVEVKNHKGDGSRPHTEKDSINIDPKTPEEVLEIWYRALREKNRSLLGEVMIGGAGGFKFGDVDSISYEIEKTVEVNSKDEVNSYGGAQKGDVVILTKEWNAETGDSLAGHYFLFRRKSGGWIVYGHSSRSYRKENLPPEMK